MKFQELVELQQSANELLAAYPETPSQLAMAVIEECGEISRALRSRWRWWQWSGQVITEDREELLAELADLLKFLLVGTIKFEAGTVKVVSPWWADSDEWNSRVHPESKACDLMAQISLDVGQNQNVFSLMNFISLCAALGVSREEIEAAFMAKAAKNLERIKVDKLEQ